MSVPLSPNHLIECQSDPLGGGWEPPVIVHRVMGLNDCIDYGGAEPG